MADIVNLTERRKRRDREQRKTEADAKRMLFGRTKGDKARQDKERSADVRKLDGAERERISRDKDKSQDRD